MKRRANGAAPSAARPADRIRGAVGGPSRELPVRPLSHPCPRTWNTAGTARLFATTDPATDPATAQGPRRPDGGPPATRFLTMRGTAGADMTER